MQSRTRTRALLFIFFLSGISALIYQTVWLKNLGLVFGNTVYAASTVIAIYLAGLGIGAFLFGRRVLGRSPLLVYAVLEALIGVAGSLSSNGFALLDQAYVASFQSFIGSPLLLALARVLFVSLFLLPPTILMGGTLPVLVRWVEGEWQGKGKAISALYAVNTFGAVAGVALAGFYLIPKAGLLTTLFCAVVLNFLLALISVLLGYGIRSGRQEPSSARNAVEMSSRSAPAVLLVTFLMGLTSIADEVFWSRVLVLHLGSSVYAYALMLTSFLIGIAVGSALINRVIDRIDPVRTLFFFEIVLAAALALQIHYFVRFADVLEALARALNATTYEMTLVVLLLAVLSALLLPTAIMGATFPLVVRLYSERTGAAEGRASGVVYFFNTFGSILGSLLAGFVIIRWVGSQNGLFLMALINLLIAVVLFRSGPAGRRWIPALASSALVVALAFVFATPDQIILSAGLFADRKAPVLLFREDVTATVTLRLMQGKFLSLELNGVNVAGTSPDLIGTQQLQGHLPLLVHGHAKKVLHIGFGSGGTAYAVSRHPVDQIRIAEISPEVLEVSDSRLRSVNHGVLSDPRVKVEINDGRNFILATPETFDVILSDSIHPRYAGNGSLYTRDYFELCRRKLAPGGVISMWLPFYTLTTRNYLMILRAFSDVFPNTTVWYVPNAVNPFTIVMGRLEPGPIPLDRIERGLTPAVRADLAQIGIQKAADIAGALLIDPEGVQRVTAGIEPHVDDRPAVEYESGRLLDRVESWARNFAFLLQNMTPMQRGFQGSIGSSDEIARREKERRTRFLGHLRILLRELEYVEGPASRSEP